MIKINSNQNIIKRYLLILPIVFIVLMGGGAYLGIQSSHMWGMSDSIIWPIIFTTLSFGISIVISILISKI
jgi:hydrogenase/urease accessory protein HupE